ncbi:MAG: winged helix-turn-helix transcriptional regulator [Gemmatimonadales bacterium]|jgi:DNA-binding MarR family transcriptional regulator|nr:winged helix-turn-helix transcriptional regulator [Gemmatimonadales bacterium]MDG2239277.1 MarR family winged helix-turn-helix transcriptional regulator [Longimicrobiales bacterium]NCG31884.1 MarR family transcriptional regulator [Pseudomonadota bacterium]MBT3774706.1 winged helix-turn-helix transcriptional regulator [Gemmatimonadales bacterium]MBT3959133.1 winged helix-turn-helix transcriptional regulator [Gemmatimonadales bacterium]
MSDIHTFLSAYPRIRSACRMRHVADPESGKRLTAHQAGILRHLDTKDPVMVGELAEHLGVTASTMSLTLSRLEVGGFIFRERDAADRRVMNVLLTDHGERMREGLADLDPDRVHRMLQHLDPESRRLALRGLGLLAEAADALTRSGREHVDALSDP